MAHIAPMILKNPFFTGADGLVDDVLLYSLCKSKSMQYVWSDFYTGDEQMHFILLLQGLRVHQ